MAVETLYGTEYNKLLQVVKAYYGSGSDQWAEIAKYGISSEKAYDILKSVPNVDIVYNKNGSVRSYVNRNYNTYFDTADDIAGKINSNVIGGTASPSKSVNLSIPSNTKVNTTTKTLEMTSEIGKKVSTGEKVIGTLANIGQAVFAVGVGCTLGKTIDKALYNLNPDFWNAHDMETLNPDVWGEITNSGSTGDNIFNALMGVDPVTNETTAYVDQNALAYMAWYLQSKDIFKEGNYEVTDVPENLQDVKDNVIGTISAIKSSRELIIDGSGYGGITKQDKATYVYQPKESDEYRNNLGCYLANDTSFHYGYSSSNPPYKEPSLNYESDIVDDVEKDKPCYVGSTSQGTRESIKSNVPIITYKKNNISGFLTKLAWLVVYKSVKKSAVDGVGTQPDAIVPDLSGANSLEDVLNILKNTLPNIFNNAITNSVPQPDGSIKDYTYVPISLPNTNNNNDPQPETGNQTQAKPQVNPETSPDTLLDLIIKLIGKKPDTPNPPDTGTGNTPPVVLPTGSANALYKIYNPTQAEINSFGAWLWSSNFVDQLLKVFNNPMESIIGLHKVYASPIIGGRSNIKVGYLDSGVSSNFVSNQYTKIDCGTVNLQEYFGNVFDYSPYTNIELYLPCIGFVQLDVGNVMRSSINITYTVDVLTGACIAEVNVKRDGSGGVLYSYSGNCASQYPLSSGSYMGIVSSVIGVAGSIVGTVASGGSLAPLALGATSGLLNAKTHVQHSGSLSGNSGVMGGKIPYLIISRPQTNMAENYQHLQGLPSNTYVQLSACHGFTKIKNVNVQNINAESEELEEIKTLLLDGVII